MQRLKKTAEIKPPLRSELHCQPPFLPPPMPRVHFEFVFPTANEVLAEKLRIIPPLLFPLFLLGRQREGGIPGERKRERGARRHSCGRRANPIPPHHSLPPSFLGGNGKAAPSWSDGKIRENGRGRSSHPTAACLTASIPGKEEKDDRRNGQMSKQSLSFTASVNDFMQGRSYHYWLRLSSVYQW